MGGAGCFRLGRANGIPLLGLSEGDDLATGVIGVGACRDISNSVISAELLLPADVGYWPGPWKPVCTLVSC